MGILFALIAGLFSPITNFTVRKGIDIGGSAKAYYVFQMITSFILAVLLGPLRTGDFSIPFSVAISGTVAGLVLSVMLFSIGHAVQKGPPGFTFAILNSATVMPGLLMALIFGATLGFEYNVWHGLGSILVLVGLFWGAKGMKEMKEMKKWLFFATAMFAFHLILLSLFQWRAMSMNITASEDFSSAFTLKQVQSEWFTPFMFFTSGLVQLIIYLKSDRKMPKLGEACYGIAGGVSNLLCTMSVIQATVVATSLENAIIFPIYSVVGIILTNLWGQKLYQEQVNWRACQLCAFGLIVGTIDWKAVAAAIGF